MARTTKTIYTCDLHEGDEMTEGVAEVSFAFDGSAYEIDLCPDHRGEMEEAFASYVGSARRANRTGTPTPRRTSRPAASGGRATGGSDREEVQRIREWAREHGHTVSERGRLSSSVLEAYRAAH